MEGYTMRFMIKINGESYKAVTAANEEAAIDRIVRDDGYDSIEEMASENFCESSDITAVEMV